MAETLMRMYESMTEEAKKELYDFALLLVAKGASAAGTEAKASRKAGIGSDPDFYMASDFDAPLECFSEYMK